MNIRFFFQTPIFFASALLFSAPLRAQTAVEADTPVSLSPLIVTSTAPGEKPLETIINTRTPAQPIPAQDGADILKTVSGFSVSRKGGAGGEVVLRGQSGSRLGILLDGESVLGGCPHRMDPPTAYVFPSSFDRLTVLKGPQTVLYGPGNSAGVVLFERNPQRLAQPGVTLDGALTAGSFGRNDQTAEVKAGTPDFYAQANFTRTQSDDYEDGAGRKVHSQYERSNLNAALGWTPDADTLFELSANRGEGEVAYAGMGMDATQLDRDNFGLRFRKSNLSPQVAKIEAQIGYNHADHIMDDFRLRTPGMMAMGEARLDHRLVAGRGLVEWSLAESTRLTTGLDFTDGRHRSYDSGTWTPDAEINVAGVFAELNRGLSPRDRLITGLRLDRWGATDKRATIGGGMMMPPSPNPTAGEKRKETLLAGFARYEHDLTAKTTTTYLGVGVTERAPDYWEIITNESAATKSSFHTAPEKTVQLDTGLNYRNGPFTASVAAFYNRVDDYILVQSNVSKSSGMGGMGMTMATATVTRNVDTTSLGGELGAGYVFAEHWKLDTSLAWVRGRNRTDARPLAQQPPLEGRLGLVYATPVWSIGGLARFVARQNRVAVNQGTIIGQDLGPTSGFAVFALNAGWRLSRHAALTAGVDNLFDKTYAEHISRAGSAVAGYPVTSRVNEPGRTIWVRLATTF